MTDFLASRYGIQTTGGDSNAFLSKVLEPLITTWRKRNLKT